MFRELANHYLIKLKTTSLYRLLVNNLFLIAFGIILTLLFLDSFFFIIFLVLYLVYLYKKNRKIMIINLILCILVFCLFLLKKQIIFDKSLTTFKGYVISIVKKDNYNRLLVRHGIFKTYVYDYKCMEIKIGDVVVVNGQNKIIEPNHLPNLFNYQKNYYSQNIISIIKADSIDISKRFNYLYLRRWINDYINKNFSEEAIAFINGMVLGDTQYLSESTKEAIRINNISHLFAISGLHINLIVGMFNKVLALFIKDDKKKENIIMVFLFVYLIITGFMVSITRAVLMYFLNILNRRKVLLLSSLDIASITFILLIIYNPFYIYHLGFILSFSASFIIIVFSMTIKALDKKMNSFFEIIIITLILQIATLPIIVNINNQINLLSIIVNGFFISAVSFIILPVTFIVLVQPFLSFIYTYIIDSFNFLNDLFSKYFSIIITLPSFSKTNIAIYYIFLLGFICIFKNLKRTKKIIYVFLFLLSMIIYYQKINLNLKGNIYFLDVYDGDATLIDLPMNKGVVLIDTGGESSDIISFLKSTGVRQIDYLILTHKHSDHTGCANQIIKEFNVKKIVLSIYNDTSYGISTTYVKKGDVIILGDYRFQVLSPQIRSSDENDNSIVLYTKLGNYKYLFLGDVSKEIEEEIAINNLDVDVVKVAHHGSSTSTSKNLYDKIKPQYVIIETGRTKRYGLPNKSVVVYLSKYNLFRTDEDYTVIASFNNTTTKIKKTKKDF